MELNLKRRWKSHINSPPPPPPWPKNKYEKKNILKYLKRVRVSIVHFEKMYQQHEFTARRDNTRTFQTIPFSLRSIGRAQSETKTVREDRETTALKLFGRVDRVDRKKLLTTATKTTARKYKRQRHDLINFVYICTVVINIEISNNRPYSEKKRQQKMAV